MSTSFTSLPSHNLVVNLGWYFSERDAFSRETAIAIPDIDWVTIGFPENTKRPNYQFIKEENGKFWLDRDELKVFNEETQKEFKKNSKWILWFVTVLFIICMGVVIFSLFLL